MSSRFLRRRAGCDVLECQPISSLVEGALRSQASDLDYVAIQQDGSVEYEKNVPGILESYGVIAKVSMSLPQPIQHASLQHQHGHDNCDGIRYPLCHTGYPVSFFMKKLSSL